MAGSCRGEGAELSPREDRLLRAKAEKPAKPHLVFKQPRVPRELRIYLVYPRGAPVVQADGWPRLTREKPRREASGSRITKGFDGAPSPPRERPPFPPPSGPCLSRNFSRTDRPFFPHVYLSVRPAAPLGLSPHSFHSRAPDPLEGWLPLRMNVKLCLHPARARK